jgi:hypothetical protein
LIPYSSVGYKIKYDAENDTENSRRFNGTGLKKHFCVGYQINRNSAGADANYNFGKLKTSFEYINEFSRDT